MRNFQDFIDGKVAVKINNEDEHNKLIDVCATHKLNWKSGAPAKGFNAWGFAKMILEEGWENDSHLFHNDDRKLGIGFGSKKLLKPEFPEMEFISLEEMLG